MSEKYKFFDPTGKYFVTMALVVVSQKLELADVRQEFSFQDRQLYGMTKAARVWNKKHPIFKTVGIFYYFGL